MRSGEREARQVMIKCRRLPGAGAVALRTVVREASCHMVRISSAGECSLMTAIAIGRGAGVAFRVASLALQCRMCTG